MAEWSCTSAFRIAAKSCYSEVAVASISPQKTSDLQGISSSALVRRDSSDSLRRPLKEGFPIDASEDSLSSSSFRSSEGPETSQSRRMSAEIWDVSQPSQLSSSAPSFRCVSKIDEKLELLQAYRCVATLTGHVGVVSSIVLSGGYLYTASHGNDIRVWRKPDLLLGGRFGCGEGAVKAIIVAGSRVFSARQDHKIRVWRPSSSQPTRHIRVATLPTVKDYLINCLSQKNYVQARRHHTKLWIEHTDTISVLAVGKFNKLLYSGSWDRTFKVWRLSDLKCIESVRAHDDAVNALVVSGDDFVYTAAADGQIKVWKKRSKEEKHSLVATLTGHNSAVNALALSTDGEQLYSAGSDCGIRVWGRKTHGQAHCISLLFELKGHRLPIHSLCTQGNLLLSGSADKTLRAWIRATDDSFSCVAALRGHRGNVKSMCIGANLGGGWLVYSGSSDKTIKVWWLSREI